MDPASARADEPGSLPAERAIAGVWGFAEATLFFVVPDVWLTAVGLGGLRRGLVACGWALVGALAGGAIMYVWGGARPEAVYGVLDRIPAISTEMLAAVRGQLADRGAGAALFGPLVGTPYKTYAGLAPGAGVGALAFLLVSIPARLGRFLLLTVGAAWLAPRLLPRASHRERLAVLLAIWAAFYAGYFVLMAG